ncbi:MAG TPA: hypothetical protein VEP49_02405 [Acidimicrobiia bacterium]|nr:hypothetical protein [Acidimicrobiia bacterium]
MRRRFLLVVAAVVLAKLFVFERYVHPWMARWGASDAEVDGTLQADALVRPDVRRTTRAITVDAPVSAVWPWLVQIGEDQAGFYSYSWLERLARTDMHNADTVHEEWQQRERGDTVWLGHRWGELGRQVAAVCEPGRALVLVSPRDFAAVEAGRLASGYWGFFLEPIDGERTRVIVRSSGGAVGTAWFDVVHFLMEQKMMRGLEQRAEHAWAAA